MKQTAGFAVVVAAALAFARLGGGPSPGTNNQAPLIHTETASPKVKPPAKGSGRPYVGGCTAYDPTPDPSPYPHDDNKAAATEVIEKFFGLEPNKAGPAAKLQAMTHVKYAVALAADPQHTNLGLMFDRAMVAIQQAAQDEQYTYDSNWLPWPTETQSYTALKGQQQASQLVEDREACPGILLFRKHEGGETAPSPAAASKAPKNARAKKAKVGPQENAYSEALILLVVSEQPTGGLNADQWNNAMRWLQNNASQKGQEDDDGKETPDRVLHILGPSFSGTFVSLDRALTRIYGPQTAPVPNGATTYTRGAGEAGQKGFRGKFPSVIILSGPVTGCGPITWFGGRWHDQVAAKEQPGVLFRTFQENDSLAIFRFLSYLSIQGLDASDTAIVSEDETAYGQAGIDGQASPPNQPSCDFVYPKESRPVSLYYPRDISALRIAYEQQSIFSSGSPSGEHAHAILHGDGSPTETVPETTDTIHAYSGQSWPIAQEAVLYGIVSYLRTHHTRYLLLRCTNPLDFLFLTRFFHRAYPEARIVTAGSDLLFRREIDTTEFRGTLALTTYPLLPRNSHWSALNVRPDAPSHVHRAFESHDMEGWYLAARYGFNMPAIKHPLDERSLPYKNLLSDFADPYWLHAPGEIQQSPHPPTWLSVVGTDGYWPVAVLSDKSTPDFQVTEKLCAKDRAQPAPLSTVAHRENDSGNYALNEDDKIGNKDCTKSPCAGASSSGAGTPAQRFDDKMLFKPPMAWKICALCSLLLVIYQVFGLTSGTSHASAGIFSAFRQVSVPLHGVNSAITISILLVCASILLMLPGISFLAQHQCELWSCLGLGLLAAVATPIILSKNQILPTGQNSWLTPTVAYVAILCVVVPVAISALDGNLSSHSSLANNLPTFYRACHLTSGVSPLLPVILLLTGFYLWTWQGMAGDLMLQEGRPRLPKFSSSVDIQWNKVPQELFRISDKMDEKITEVACPTFFKKWSVLIAPAVSLFALLVLFHGSLPLLSLEGFWFSLWINLGLVVAFLLTITEAMRLFLTWQQLRRLLTALNRLRLRRTFAKLQPIETNSLWGMSGDLNRTQYFFFSQQVDAARRLLLRVNGSYFASLQDVVLRGKQFNLAHADKLDRGFGWSQNLQRPNTVGPQDMVSMRDVLADAVAQVITSILLPAWECENDSLSLKNESLESDDQRMTRELPPSANPVVRDAEEFVCLHYIGYIQNILARMRTMILSGVLLFVFMCFSISFYPFVPRTEIGFWLILNLACICASVIYVYAGMARDPTLSYMTDTKPGELGPEFWVKVTSFLAGPLIGIVTTQFPAIADTFLGWLQPGLDAIK